MFKGSIVALVTPFTEQNHVDYQKLQDLIEWQIASSTDAIVLCGTTGEAPTLSEEEQVMIFKEAVSVAKGRIPLIAGTGSYNTRHAMKMTELAQKWGMDAALIVFPYYNKPTAEGCFQHFQELSKIGLPLIIYHHPGRTGIKLSVPDLARIAALPRIAAVKDASGDVNAAVEFMQQVEIPLLSGEDSLVVPLMASGAAGVISIVANVIPLEWKQLTTFLLNHQWNEARQLFRYYYPLVKAMVLETNPQCVKSALGMLGKCSSKVRLPLVEPQESIKQQIISAMTHTNLYQSQEIISSFSA